MDSLTPTESYLLDLCHANDFKTLKKLVENDFPLYAYFSLLFNNYFPYHHNPSLLYFLENYLKSRQMTKWHGTRDILPALKDYKLYLLLLAEESDDAIYEYLTTNYLETSIQAITSPILINILNIDLPDRIVNIFKNFVLTAMLHRPRTPELKIKILTGLEAMKPIPFFINFFSSKKFTTTHWKLIFKMKPDKRDEIIAYLIKDGETRQKALVGILKIQGVDFFCEIIDKYNIPLADLMFYAVSCKRGEYEPSLTLLKKIVRNKVSNTKFTTPVDTTDLTAEEITWLKSEPENRTCLIGAVNFSYESGNPQLDQFNTELLQKNFNLTPKEIEKSLCYGPRHDIDKFLAVCDKESIEKHYSSYFESDHPLNKTLETEKKLLLYLEEKDIIVNVNLPLWNIYHLMETGYKDKLARVQHPEEVNDIAKITKHFDDYNNKLKPILKEMNNRIIKIWDVTLIVFNYARY